MTAKSGGGSIWGVEGVSKAENGLTDMDSSVVIAGEGGIRGLDDNGKSTIEVKLKEEKIKIKTKKEIINSFCFIIL